MKCINEIGSLELSHEYDDKFVILHDMTMASLRRIIPLETGKLIPERDDIVLTQRIDIRAAYDQTNDSEVQEFIQNLALFFSTFLGKHVKVCVSVKSLY